MPQPINTAPKDGTDIWVLTQTADYAVDPGWACWKGTHWRWSNTDALCEPPPTQWLPIMSNPPPVFNTRS